MGNLFSPRMLANRARFRLSDAGSRVSGKPVNGVLRRGQLCLRWQIDDCWSRSDILLVRGWIFAMGQDIRRLDLVLRGSPEEQVFEITNRRQPREDVAAATGRPEAAHCGFTQAFRIPGGLPDVPRLSLRCTLPDQSAEIPIHSLIFRLAAETPPEDDTEGYTLPDLPPPEWADQLRSLLSDRQPDLSSGRRENIPGENIPSENTPAENTLAENILVFTHALGGGAEAYLTRQIQAWQAQGHTVCILRYQQNAGQPSAGIYPLSCRRGEECFEAELEKPEQLPALLDGCRVDQILVNELVTWPRLFELLPLLTALKNQTGARMILPVHDYYLLSPDFYLVSPAEEVFGEEEVGFYCDRYYDLEGRSAEYSCPDIVTWRRRWERFLRSCDEVRCFSGDSRRLIAHAYPELRNVTVVPHQVDYLSPVPRGPKATPTLNVGVLGVLTNHKGRMTVADLKQALEADRVNMKIVLIGSEDENLLREGPYFEKTGRYQPQELPEIIRRKDIDLFLIPSVCPETFSFTTEEILKMGLPAACFDLGAPAERIAKYDRGLVLSSRAPESVLEGLFSLAERCGIRVPRQRDPGEDAPPADLVQPSSAEKALRFLRDKGPGEALRRGMLRFGKARGDARVAAQVQVPEEELRRQRGVSFPRPLCFSVVVPLYNTPLPLLRQMIASVQDQSYQDWELCLADGSDGEHAEVGAYCTSLEDPRIRYQHLEKNGGISENSNAALAMAQGDYIALLDHDDLLTPNALFEMRDAIEKTGADFLYSDEMIFREDASGRRIPTAVRLKPGFSPDTLLTNNYICHLTVFSPALLQKAGSFRKAYDGSQDHDLFLRLTSRARGIAHVSKVLYLWRSAAGSVAEDIGNKQYAIGAGRRSVHDFLLQKKGLDARVESAAVFPTMYHVRYPVEGTPTVQVIVDARRESGPIAGRLRRLRDRGGWDHTAWTVITGDAAVRLPEDMERLAPEEKESRRSLWTRAANASAAEYLLFLDGVPESNESWLREMLSLAAQPHVGAVGVKVLLPEGLIRHVGVVIGLGPGRLAGRPYYLYLAGNAGYFGRNEVVQNVSAVTDALLLSRDKFEAAGGFAAEYQDALLDTDLCLRLLEQGLYNVFTPHAVLTMGTEQTTFLDVGREFPSWPEDARVFRRRNDRALRSGDAYYHPLLSLRFEDWRYR